MQLTPQGGVQNVCTNCQWQGKITQCGDGHHAVIEGNPQGNCVTVQGAERIDGDGNVYRCVSTIYYQCEAVAPEEGVAPEEAAAVGCPMAPAGC